MNKALLFLLLSISIAASAQQTKDNHQPFQKGTWLIGLQAATMKGYANSQNHDWVAKGFGGYFVAPKLLVGLAGTRFVEQAPLSYKATYYTVGPMVRYQLTRTRVSPFVVTSFQVGQAKAAGTLKIDDPSGPKLLALSSISSRVYSRSFGAGLSVIVLPALHVDVALNWQDIVDTPNLNLDYGYGRYQLQVGLSYQIGSKR